MAERDLKKNRRTVGKRGKKVSKSEEEKITAILRMGVGRSNLPDEKKILTDALKKQVPMEVTDTHYDEYYFSEYYCPACGAENIAYEGKVYHKYCPECGQKLIQKENDCDKKKICPRRI